MIGRVRSAWLPSMALALSLSLLPDGAAAQSGAGDGYLFRRPQGALSFRVGFSRPSADSRVFEFTSDEFTVNRGDFAGFSGGADLDVTMTNRLAFQLGFSVSSRQKLSEYRDYVDNNDLPIEQRTSFRRVPVTAGLKLHLTNPGTSVSRYAWVPAKFTPYIAGGGGVMHYAFRQSGDFVDFQDFEVFNTSLESTGWTGVAYGAAGFNYSLTSRLSLMTEARYDRAQAPMSTAFVGFGNIDLSGVTVTTGLHIRF